LENWADAVRNGRGLITIFGILQPIISGLIADQNEIVNTDLAPSNSTSNRKRKITVVAYPLGTGLEWWKIRDRGTLPTEDDSVHGLGYYIAPEIPTGGSSSTSTGNVWSLGCILFELCTGKKAFESQSATTKCSITEDSIPFLDGFDKSSQKVFRELIPGMMCVDVGKRLSMDEFCNTFGDVVCVINTEFVLPQEQSVSPKRFYFHKENWIGTEIKHVPHSSRIEHLVPTGNAVEDSKNPLKRLKTVVNARTKMLGVENSATRTSIEIHGWTLFFLGDSKSP
jgi:serine/threonine protein kinase